jgi:glycerol-3-phosphate dehydrogenase (NAD(P)+)
VVTSGRIAVMGAGSWGTALALHWLRNGEDVAVWARRPEHAESIRAGDNARYLPGVEIPANLRADADPNLVLDRAGLVVLAVPSAAVKETCRVVFDHFAPSEIPPVVCAAKGLESGSGRRMSEVMADALGPASSRATVLLGPSHAEEVARGLPTAIVLAGGDPRVRRELQARLASATMRIYTNDDLVGVESAAALKNVLAIAAGICDGLDLGDNVKGALLTRGLTEISRLGVALGGRRETFFGLSGVGDVITTCLSRHSRNRALGELVGRGRPLEAAQEEVGQVVEGVATTRTVTELAKRYGIPMPISQEVDQVLFADKSPRQAITDLMMRDLKSENEATPAAKTESRR